jgi:hypothetical protein
VSDPKTIDRRTILGSTLAWAAVTLSGCSDSGGTTGDGGGGGAGGACGGAGGHGAGGADAGGGTVCTVSMTGTHVHPLIIPGSDVDRGYQEAPYTLLDGGTCHTHTLELSAYDFAYLHAGATRMIDSSTTENHLHTVTIACTLG